jgi:dihydrodipicolinate synthase/N-acetylneuraminate lyase
MVGDGITGIAGRTLEVRDGSRSMKELYPITGIYAIPQTPFDDRGQVDFKSLERGVDDRLAAGVDGLLVPVVASEVGHLDERERRSIIEAVLRQVGERVPVIVGASSPDPKVARDMAAYGTELGAAAVCVQAPTPLLRDEPALRRYFDVVCEAPVQVLVIQDLEWNGPGLPIPTIVRFFDEIEAFRGIKVETTPAGPKYTEILEATQGRLNVSGGWAVTQLIEALDRGVHAMMAGGLHWILVEVVRRYRGGDRAGARDLFGRLLPILAWQGQHIDISNRFLKQLAVKQGIYDRADLRGPDVPFDAYHQHVADELLEDALRLHDEVGWVGASTS